LEGYCITLAKPRKKAIPTSFCNNIINHETNKGIVITLQNFVEVKPFTINVANIAIPSFTCTDNFALVH
jgi:hypothetical protein